MPQVTSCPHCGKSLQIPDDAVGKPVRCPLCQQLFAVRAAPSPAPVFATRDEPRTPNGALTEGGTTTRPARLSSGRGVAPSAPPAPTVCPACKAPLLAGATTCLDCGYLLPVEGAAL